MSSGERVSSGPRGTTESGRMSSSDDVLQGTPRAIVPIHRQALGRMLHLPDRLSVVSAEWDFESDSLHVKVEGEHPADLPKHWPGEVMHHVGLRLSINEGTTSVA